MIMLFILPIMWMIFQKHSDAEYLEKFVNSLGQLPVNLTFEDIQYYGFDDKDNLVHIEAPSAIADDINTQNIALKRPKISVVNEKKRPIDIRANEGIFSREAENIALTGQVEILEKQDNTKVTTNLVTYNMGDGTLEAPQQVDVKTRQGYISSGAVTGSRDNKKLRFERGVYVKINPSAK
ncbi:MAG: LPS export ABC transporter periplasmic protein LptC [Pseudomonadota bacterium]